MKTKKLELKVSGMHCSSCEMLVKDVLSDDSGVKRVEISHKTGVLEVEYDEKQTNGYAIKSTVRGLGYGVE